MKDVLRMDYDREVYDPITLLGFAERYASTKDYAGFAIDLATKAIEAIEAEKQNPLCCALKLNSCKLRWAGNSSIKT